MEDPCWRLICTWVLRPHIPTQITHLLYEPKGFYQTEFSKGLLWILRKSLSYFQICVGLLIDCFWLLVFRLMKVLFGRRIRRLLRLGVLLLWAFLFLLLFLLIFYSPGEGNFIPFFLMSLFIQVIYLCFIILFNLVFTEFDSIRFLVLWFHFRPIK